MATSELFPDSLQAGMGSSGRSEIFNQFIQRCANLQPMKVAVIWPSSDVALAGAMEAFEAGLILPLLVGEEKQLRALAEQRGTLPRGRGLRLDERRPSHRPSDERGD
jgi:hypothetical protein